MWILSENVMFLFLVNLASSSGGGAFLLYPYALVVAALIVAAPEVNLHGHPSC